MIIQTIVFGLAGGLALFLYGMFILSDGLQKVAGDKLKRTMELFTKSPLRGVATGATFTAIIQSSSVTTVTLLGLINAGLVTLSQSVGVILGADIGTTITAQLVAFKIGAFALPIVAVGFVISVTAKSNKVKYVGEAILGFGILFLGMNFMSAGVKPLKTSATVMGLLVDFGKTPFLGILAGAIFTAVIQSSSATSGLVIAMSMQGLLNLEAAIALMLGANIGTCATALLASIGATISAKRAAIIHLFFKVFGVLIIFLPFPFFVRLASMTASSLPRQIANAHTLFNVGITLVFLPLGFAMVKFVKMVLPGQVIEVERGTKYIDKRLLSAPTVALSSAEKDVVRMSEIVLGMIGDSKRIFLNNEKKLIKVVSAKEDSVDEIDEILDAYMTILSEKSMPVKDKEKLAGLMHAITDLERVGDHLNNIVELAERKEGEKVKFSTEAINDLRVMFEAVENIFGDTVKALKGEDGGLIKKIFDEEGEIDRLEKEFESAHMARLDKGACDPHAGVIFVDVLRNLERIGDHSDNIAHMMLVGF
jgi:phosphate:Na+ symporter